MSGTFNDAIGPSTMQTVMEWVRLHSESATGRQGYACTYKRNVEIFLLDPSLVVVEKWILVNTFLGNVSGGNLAYNSDGIATVSADLIYDYAILPY